MRTWATVRFEDGEARLELHYAEPYMHHERGGEEVEVTGAIEVEAPEALRSALAAALANYDDELRMAARRAAVSAENTSIGRSDATYTLRVGGTIAVEGSPSRE